MTTATNAPFTDVLTGKHYIGGQEVSSEVWAWYSFAVEALEAIAGPEDSGPFIGAYRSAGGGYEGLQAIAKTALGRNP
jgi:hypothetical protein